MPTLSGTTKNDLGELTSKIVRVYGRAKGEFVGATVSDPTTGAWSVPTTDTSLHFAVMHDTADGDPLWGKTALLIRADGADGSTVITNEAGWPVTTVSGVTISTDLSKFGGSCLKFADKTAYVEMGSHPAYVIGAGDFTAEFFLNRSNNNTRVSLLNSTSSKFGISLDCPGGGGAANIFVYLNGSLVASTSGGFVPYNGTEFTHVAVTRASGMIKVFIGGVERASGTSSYNVPQGSYRIGTDGYGGLVGYIDDVRLTIGAARYSGDFTPPTSSFAGALSGGSKNAVILDMLTPV